MEEHACGVRGHFSWVLLALTLLANSIGQGHAIEVTVDITASLVHVGENVTVVCTVRPSDPGTIVFISKAVIATDGTEYVEQISTNDLITPLYAETGRYSAKVGSAGDAYLFFLYISNIQPNDGGIFMCQHPKEGVKAGASVEVYNPPDAVLFNNHTSDSTIIFQEGVGQAFTCYAKAASPQPTLSIRVGSMDVSDRFTVSSSKNVICPPGDGKTDCLLTVDYDASLVKTDFVPYFEQDEARIVCSADIGKDSGMEAIETSLYVEVLYSPKITISETCPEKVGLKSGQNNVVLECNVRFNPAPEDSSVFWFAVSSDGKNHTLGTRDSGDGLRAGFKIIGPKSWNITLTIDQMLDKYFTTYELAVTNSVGRTVHSIQLIQDDPIDDAIGAVGSATALYLSGAALATAATTLALVGHL